MLTDDSRDPRAIPTRANVRLFSSSLHPYREGGTMTKQDLLLAISQMIQAMQWLVQGAQPNDSLFFHYSGHGFVPSLSCSLCDLYSARY